MRKIVLLVGLIILSVKVNAQTICEGQTVVPVTTFNQCDNNPWVLVFEDEFNGNSLDLSRWSYGPRIRYCNDEQQYYTSGDNIVVSNGTLKLIAKKETVYAKAVDWLPANEHLYCTIDGVQVDRGQNTRYFYYTSANIETIKKFSYGKFEARIKIPKGKGFWPAYWTFGGNPWNEIDVFEFWNEDNLYGNYDPSKLSKVHHMTAHYDYDNDGNDNMCGTKYTGLDFSQSFHIYTLIWEKNKIEWYVDGVLKRTDFRYYTILGQTTGCTIEAWHQYILNKIYPKDPMAIILNLAIQSGSNSPDNSTPFPSQMEVDWVKYYSKHPYQNVYISGASLICTSNNSTFTLHNIPPNSITIWTHSSNLTQIGGNTGTTYTVKAKNSYVNSQEWVKATVNGIEFKKTFWVGKPGQPITDPPGYPTYQMSLGQIKTIRVVSAPGNPYQYVWNVTGSITKISGGGTQCTVEATSTGWGNFYVKSINDCGTSVNGGGSVNVSSGGGGGILLSPNPVNNILTIEINNNNTPDNLNNIDLKTSELRIYDKMMTLKKQKQFKGDLVKINVTDLQEGVYIIQLISGKKIYEEKIIISH